MRGNSEEYQTRIDKRKQEFEQTKKIYSPNKICDGKTVHESLNDKDSNFLKGQPVSSGIAE
ncbi:hypothetical protein BBF96_13810 [Anoxybacter fermentans]|uniref:Uncharacterized protein n=1 Tax=Anoxybacter fermentans TaxID=1323375 RepID=A0A3S9T1G4_9FIRM|nr:hypothetical protein [Anoxybacter fermentans]AZR74369.1 hypothetical protein BBF96_13810 [Anoxybacter fermentans]